MKFVQRQKYLNPTKALLFVGLLLAAIGCKKISKSNDLNTSIDNTVKFFTHNSINATVIKVI